MVLDFVYLLVDLCVFYVSNALTCIVYLMLLGSSIFIEQPSHKDIFCKYEY